MKTKLDTRTPAVLEMDAENLEAAGNYAEAASLYQMAANRFGGQGRADRAQNNADRCTELAKAPCGRDKIAADHTPTPWIVEPIAHSGDFAIYHDVDGSSEMIGRVVRRVYPNGQPFHASDIETEANAALIVRAVNCHAGFCRLAKFILDYKAEGIPLHKLQSMASDILARAEGRAS